MRRTTDNRERAAETSLDAMRNAAASCTRCELYRNATQTVFGGGSARAKLMLVGEQPGNEEDLQGEPFVGPAGRLLRNVLEEIGIPLDDVYLTNVVKHFKWTPRGKRRLHQRPNAAEVKACKPWLLGEIERIQPQLIVCLGATAAKALLGSAFRVTHSRGRVSASSYGAILPTVHPSSILRQPTEEDRHAALQAFAKDLKAAHAWVRQTQRARGPPSDKSPAARGALP